MSFVTWPARNSFASAPVSASLPRSERSTSPAPSAIATCSEVTVFTADMGQA